MAPMAIDREQIRRANSVKPLIPMADNKRKTADDVDNISTSSKRLKSSLTTTPIPEKRPISVVPFPEKVSCCECANTASPNHLLMSEPIARGLGRAQRRD